MTIINTRVQSNRGHLTVWIPNRLERKYRQVSTPSCIMKIIEIIILFYNNYLFGLAQSEVSDKIHHVWLGDPGLNCRYHGYIQLYQLFILFVLPNLSKIFKILTFIYMESLREIHQNNYVSSPWFVIHLQFLVVFS